MKTHIAEAIAVVVELPEERQAAVVRAILDYATEDTSAYRLEEEERSEIVGALAELKRGELASDATVAETYYRLGL